PTAALSPHEVTKLFDIIHELKRQGVSLIYVSHRLDEILDIGDDVTILRGGRVVESSSVADLDHSAMVRAITGSSESTPGSRTARKRTEAESQPKRVLEETNLVGIELA